MNLSLEDYIKELTKKNLFCSHFLDIISDKASFKEE